MYSYNNSIPQTRYINPTNLKQQDERFVGPLVPLLIGGIGGYALSQANNNNNCCPYPVPYPQPYPYPYPNNYYPSSNTYYSKNYYYPFS